MIVSLTVRCELFGISRDVNQVQHDTLIPCVKGKQGVANIQIGLSNAGVQAHDSSSKEPE